MKFSVAHAAGSTSFWQELESAEDITVQQAIEKSKLLDDFPTLDLEALKVGIFGKVCKLTQILQEGERVEVYLPAVVHEIDDDDDDDE